MCTTSTMPFAGHSKFTRPTEKRNCTQGVRLRGIGFQPFGGKDRLKA